jgi:hypothetical protein
LFIVLAVFAVANVCAAALLPRKERPRFEFQTVSG